MEEENKSLTTGNNGSWKSFILASACVLPLATFTLLHLIGANYGMMTLLGTLKFCAAFFEPVFPIVAVLVLISSGFALMQHPKTFPILTLYALFAIGHILTWVLVQYAGDL